MTKCLQLARMFHSIGDRVIVLETPLYKYCGTRFSNAIDKFLLIPIIEEEGEAYQKALVNIAKEEKVDLFVPVASPKAALIDARAKPFFPEHTEVFHFDEEVVKRLDDKHQFSQLCQRFGLTAPESHLIHSREQLLHMTFTNGKKYMLKKIEYDPVYRLDLRTIPHLGWEDRVKALPISPEEPWVLQEYIEGKEVCTHTTTRKGQVNLYVCSESSPFQVNYDMVELPRVRTWVESFVNQLNATGQISFDFILRESGEVIPIECNPRTHSAITVFHNQLRAGEAYLEGSERTQTYLPDKQSRHTYWIYHELHRIFTSKSLKRLKFLIRRIATGKEAVFSWSDPWPFFFNNHISIPYQLFKIMKAGKPWSKIDFNIGKIVVLGGD